MLLVSGGFKAALLGPNSFASIFQDGQIRIFAGSRPVSAERAEPSDPIAVVVRAGSNPGLRFQLTDQYVIKPPTDFWRLKGLAPGTAVWWRLVAAGDTHADTASAPRIDGDIGTSTSPKEIVLNSTTITPGLELAFDSFLYTFPPLPTA